MLRSFSGKRAPHSTGEFPLGSIVAPPPATPLATRAARGFAACVLLLGAGNLAAQVPGASDPIVGSWSGPLAVQPGVELTLVFHIAAEDTGYSATLDSPDQGAVGVPVPSVSFDGSTIRLELPPLAASFEGTLTSADEIEGVWEQGGTQLPLVLRRTEAGATLTRPQHPEPPFPYELEEVSFTSADGAAMAGTLTLPTGDGPFPAVVLITGSGPQDRDETIVGHKPFLVLADHLTRRGVAVLRYDDRGVGESGGGAVAARRGTPGEPVEVALGGLIAESHYWIGVQAIDQVPVEPVEQQVELLGEGSRRGSSAAPPRSDEQVRVDRRPRRSTQLGDGSVLPHDLGPDVDHEAIMPRRRAARARPRDGDRSGASPRPGRSDLHRRCVP